VELFYQAYCKWYLKLPKADTQALIYPWTSRIRDHKGILLRNPTDIPIVLPLLKKFVHKLILCMTGACAKPPWDRLGFGNDYEDDWVVVKIN